MASFLPIAVIVSLLAAGAASADDYGGHQATKPAPAAGGEKKIKVWVEGTVYCQSCARRNSWGLDGAAPVPGAKVMVTCRDAKNRVAAWRHAVTDEHGYFLAEFGVAVCGAAGGYYGGGPAMACFARLLASPDRGCDVPTNINYGVQGAPLRDEGKRWPGEGYGNVVYAAAGPLAFRPASCAPTHHY